MFQRMPPATHLRQILEGVPARFFFNQLDDPGGTSVRSNKSSMRLHDQHSGHQCHHYTSQCHHYTMGIERIRRNC